MRKEQIFTYAVIYFYTIVFALCCYIGIYGVEIKWNHFALLALLCMPTSIVIFKAVERKAARIAMQRGEMR